MVFSEAKGKVSVRVKQYLRDENGTERLGKPVSVLVGPYNQAGTRDLEELFDTKVFDFPKPVDLIKYFLSFVVNGDTDKNFILLDFFAGSGSSAQAIIKLNAEDGGSRRFITVQLPEACPPKSEAALAGYSTIAELSRERIRRAGEKVANDRGLLGANLDTGFRTLRIDTTNMTDVMRSPDETDQLALSELEGSVKLDRSGEDLLFQVLLDWGLELTMPIAVEEIEGHQVFVIEDSALIACFDAEVSPELVRTIAKREPLRAVFRDAGFASDDARINAEQIFREMSPATEVKAI